MEVSVDQTAPAGVRIKRVLPAPEEEVRLSWEQFRDVDIGSQTTPEYQGAPQN